MPDSAPAPDPASGNASDDDLEAGDDVALDYRLLLKVTQKNKDGQITIPKRGEKDFEPLEKGQNVQGRALREGREAMFAALEGVRGGNFKTISHAWLQHPSAPTSSLPVVLVQRGTHFTTLSHTLRPPPPSSKPTTSTLSAPKAQTTTVLLPEEALHLLSRGSLALYFSPLAAPNPASLSLTPSSPSVESQLLTPDLQARKVSVQEAQTLWADELGAGRFEVYVGLKRMGYVVQRSPTFMPASSSPVVRPPLKAAAGWSAIWRAAWGRLGGWFGTVLRSLRGWTARFRSGSRCGYGASRKEDGEWTTLLSQRSVLKEGKEWNYTRMFNRLRIIPFDASSISPSAKLPDSSAPTPSSSSSDLQIHYHIWKPSTTYKKTSPPPPDFYVSVVDGRTTSVPAMADLMRVLEETPALEEPPAFKPRPQGQGAPSHLTPQPVRDVHSSSSSQQPASSWVSVVSGFFSRQKRTSAEDEDDRPPRGAGKNPMPFLKQGDRNVVLAVVTDGGVSWMRFGRGVFAEMGIQ